MKVFQLWKGRKFGQKDHRKEFGKMLGRGTRLKKYGQGKIACIFPTTVDNSFL